MLPIFIDVLGAYFIARRYSSWPRLILFAVLLGIASTLIGQIGFQLMAPGYLTGEQILQLSLAGFFIHSAISLLAVFIFRLFMTRSRKDLT